jgi:hypothetical protein
MRSTFLVLPLISFCFNSVVAIPVAPSTNNVRHDISFCATHTVCNACFTPQAAGGSVPTIHEAEPSKVPLFTDKQIQTICAYGHKLHAELAAAGHDLRAESSSGSRLQRVAAESKRFASLASNAAHRASDANDVVAAIKYCNEARKFHRLAAPGSPAFLGRFSPAAEASITAWGHAELARELVGHAASQDLDGPLAKMVYHSELAVKSSRETDTACTLYESSMANAESARRKGASHCRVCST